MSRVHYLEGDYEQLVINETIDGLFSSYRIDAIHCQKDFSFMRLDGMTAYLHWQRLAPLWW